MAEPPPFDRFSHDLNIHVLRASIWEEKAKEVVEELQKNKRQKVALEIAKKAAYKAEVNHRLMKALKMQFNEELQKVTNKLPESRRKRPRTQLEPRR